MKTRYLTILSFFLLLSHHGLGQGSGKVPVTPTLLLFPSAQGILFPGFNSAAGVNPASLGLFKKATGLQLAYSPGLRDFDPHDYMFSFAHASRSFGFGLGLTGNHFNGTHTNGIFTGLGYSFNQISLGLAVRETNLSGSLDPSVDFGLIIGDGSGLNGGVVLYQVESSARISVGIGFSGRKKYNLEANILLPPFSDLGADYSTYRISVAANIFIDFLSFYFGTSYLTSWDEYTHTLGLGIWFSESFNIQFQFTTPRSWTLGISYLF